MRESKQHGVSRFQVAGVLAATIAALLASPASASDEPWPEIPAAEKALERVPSAPGAPSVVLLNRGELQVDELGRSHCIDLYRRIKVLTDEGKGVGNLSFAHSPWWRLSDLEARTHRPDGSIVPLAAKDVFEETAGKRKQATQTSLALPQVEPGSILEIRARQCFDGFLFAYPWFFQESVPTLRSELIVDRPKSFSVLPYRRIVPSHDLQESVEDLATRWRFTFVLEDLPGIRSEPLSFPSTDLSSNLIVVSHEVAIGAIPVPLLNSWEQAIALFQGNADYGYQSARRADGSAKARAKGMTQGLDGERAKAEVLYRFVRDEISFEGGVVLSVVRDSVRQFLKRGAGDSSEQVLLLQAMLKAVGIRSSIVWARSKWIGRSAEDIPNPWQFNQVLLAAEIGGERIFLDPSDASLAFGAIDAGLEGTKALLVDEKEPEWVVLPRSIADDNQSRAKVMLEVGHEGVVSGSAELVLTGQAAWEQLFPQLPVDERETRWLQALEESFPDFEIKDVKLVEDIDLRRVEVVCALALRTEARVEDEVSLAPSAPLSMVLNPFTLEPDRRLSPVLFDYPWIEKVELFLRWPEGWEPDNQPLPAAKTNEVGGWLVEVRLDPQARQLILSRSLKVEQVELFGQDAYSKLYELYRAVQVRDAEPLILVKRSASASSR